MKILTCTLCIIFSMVLCKVSAQSIDVAATMTTADANFYKNVPGLSLSYSYDLKKQFIFIELNAAHNNKFDYAEYYKPIQDWYSDSYYIHLKKGSFSTAGVNLGIAQKLIASECFSFSVGIKGGLNYYKVENEVQYLSFHTEYNGTLKSNSEIEKRKNKPGIGFLVDMELKQFIMNNLSLFSRLDGYHSGYIDRPVPRDNVPKTFNINSIGFRIGLKLRINGNE